MPLFHAYYSPSALNPTDVNVPPMIADTANTVFHVYSPTNGKFADTKNGIWVNNASSPFSAASGAAPPALGPFAAGMSYTSGSGVDAADVTGNFTCAVVLRWPCLPATGPSFVPVSDGFNGQPGWYVNLYGTITTASNGVIDVQINSSPIRYFPTNRTLDDVSLVMFGRSGTTAFIQSNNDAYTSATCGTGAAPTRALTIGNYSAGGIPYTNRIYEVFFSTDTPTSASFSNIYTQVKARLGSLIP